MAVKPNIKSINALRPRASRYDESVIGRPGLTIRVWPSGKLTAFHRFKIGTQTFKTKLGDYGVISLQAILAKHAEQRHQLALGQNPAAESQRVGQQSRNNPTIRDLAERYLEEYARPNKRTAIEDERMLAKDVLPRWGKLQAQLVTRSDVRALVDDIIARGAQTQARKTLAVLKAMFGFAIDKELLNTDPTLRLSVKPAPPRDRSLSDSEISIFWNGLSKTQLTESMRNCLRIQLYTGQRIGEICGMRWSELDLSAQLWRIPMERSKNKRSNVLPLTSSVLDIFRRVDVNGARRTEHVFFGHGKAGHLTAGTIAHQLHDALPHFCGSDGKPIPSFTSHDLRRTAASGLAGQGVPRLIVDRILNHLDNSVTGRHYDQYAYLPEMRAALEAWGRKLDQITTGKESNITPLRRRERKAVR